MSFEPNFTRVHDVEMLTRRLEILRNVLFSLLADIAENELIGRNSITKVGEHAWAILEEEWEDGDIR